MVVNFMVLKIYGSKNQLKQSKVGIEFYRQSKNHLLYVKEYKQEDRIMNKVKREELQISSVVRKIYEHRNNCLHNV